MRLDTPFPGRRRKPTAPVAAPVSEPVRAAAPPAVKRKRGRPRKGEQP